MSGQTWNSHAKEHYGRGAIGTIVEHCSSIGDEVVTTTFKDFLVAGIGREINRHD